MNLSRAMSEIERIVETLVEDSIDAAESEDEYGWELELAEGRIGEALSELDQLREDIWRYHLDNHTGPIAYCKRPTCTEDNRAGLVASILRGE